ncbi:MAG: hypothetical protein IJG31_07290 [Fusobacterium sp.]|nr:hypothetical protein [Fusobacterium sp.]
MDLKTNLKKLSEYGKEICLQNLLLINRIKEDLDTKGDLAGVEKLEHELIPIYEKIYFSLDEDILEELIKNDDKIQIFENIQKSLDKILEDSSLKKDFIEKQLNKRRELKGKSGAEVIKKFNEYKLKEYKKKRADLLEKTNKILDEEEKLNLDLSNAIQENLQMEIIEKLQPIRQEYRSLEQQITIYQKEILKCEDILNKKWPYEIYGTREEKEFLDVFLSVYDDIHIN